MNCSVCGGPLLFSRVAFHCSCGAYVHPYCLDKHILLAHRPEFEEGTVDLNGDFHPLEEKVEPTTGEVAGALEGVEAHAAEEGAEEQQAAVEEEETEGEEAEAATNEPGFVEVETVPEEEKLDSGDTDDDH